MPLFGSKFSPKKSGPRKYPSMSNLNLDASDKNVVDTGPIKIRLGSQEITFDDGEWIPDAAGDRGGVNSKEMARMRKQYQQVVEENNLLKYKVDILLDMLTERTAEGHFQDQEIDQLKKEMANYKQKKR